MEQIITFIEQIIDFIIGLTTSEKIIISIIIVIATILIIIVCKKSSSDEYEEMTTKDKMYKAITILVYIIIAIFIIKVLFWTGLISAISNH